jgi:hypothetical protein
VDLPHFRAGGHSRGQNSSPYASAECPAPFATLDAGRAFLPELIISDILMTGMTGIKAAIAVRSSCRTVRSSCFLVRPQPLMSPNSAAKTRMSSRYEQTRSPHSSSCSALHNHPEDQLFQLNCVDRLFRLGEFKQ